MQLRPDENGSGASAIEPLRFRIDVGAPANINARLSHLAESETASSEKPAAGAGRQRAAKELLSGEIPEGQSLEDTSLRGPKGPSCNSHDREVVVVVLEMIEEVRRTGMIQVGPSGLNCLLGDCYPDLTVGAITWRRFAPHEPLWRKTETGVRLAICHSLSLATVELLKDLGASALESQNRRPDPGCETKTFGCGAVTLYYEPTKN